MDDAKAQQLGSFAAGPLRPVNEAMGMQRGNVNPRKKTKRLATMKI